MIFFDTRTCMYPNCFDENVKSHAVSHSISLKSIAEDFHLYSFAPRQNSKDTKKPWLKKISTNMATRHYCFCDTHEEVFKKLDDFEIESSKDILLQVYRSLCVVYNQEKTAAINLGKLNDRESYKDISLETAEDFLRGSKFESLMPKLTEPNVLKIVQKKIKFLLSEIVDDELVEIEKLINVTKIISDKIGSIPVPCNELQTISEENYDHTILYYKTDFQIPVALNTAQHGKFGTNKIRVYSTVIPYKNSSVIMVVLPNSLLKNQLLVDKINDCFSSEYKVLKYVESTMSTSDGWFLKPSVIDNMPKEKKEFFCTDCMFLNERKLFHDYDLSIFDELKIKRFNMSSEEKELLSTPDRSDYDLRYQNMLEVMQFSDSS